MSEEVIRVVTFVGQDDYVRRDPASLALAGVCVELWDQAMQDLNLTYQLNVASTVESVFELFNQNGTDVILQRVKEDVISHRNGG